MRIGIICPSRPYRGRFRTGLAKYLQNKGHTVIVQSKWLSGVGDYDAIFTWNGYTPKDYRLRKWARRRDCRVFYIESGFFTQRTHSVISTTIPIGGQYLKDVEIPTLTQEQRDTVRQKYLEYSQGIEYKSGDYVLALLQLPKDKSIIKQSKFRGRQQFIDAVEALYPNQQIIFKTHPREKNVQVKTEHLVVRDANLHELISGAKETVAINSTGLYEAAFAGCPVRALGKSPFNRDVDPLGIVWEVLHRQVPKLDPNIDEQMHRIFGNYFDNLEGKHSE